jgi:prepilin-type N-terminal cleavage/methylation domain-containing protein
MSRIKRRQRGFTITELMTVIVIIGLAMSAVVAVIGPLVRAQSQAQAKVDTVQTAASALYRIERDVRESDSDDVFACTTGGTPTCSHPTSFDTTTSAICVLTAYQNGNGQFQTKNSTDAPNWQGVEVYWVDSTNDLNVKFDPPSGYSPGNTLSIPLCQIAVADVTSSVQELAHNVQQLFVAVPSQHVVRLRLQAQSTINGSLNETTYNTDILTRN